MNPGVWGQAMLAVGKPASRVQWVNALGTPRKMLNLIIISEATFFTLFVALSGRSRTKMPTDGNTTSNIGLNDLTQVLVTLISFRNYGDGYRSSTVLAIILLFYRITIVLQNYSSGKWALFRVAPLYRLFIYYIVSLFAFMLLRTQDFYIHIIIYINVLFI